MLETILSCIAVFTSVGVGAGIWYKLGRLDTKIDFIYNNVNIAVDWKNGSKK